MNVRTNGHGKPKYRAVKGSRLAPYGIGGLNNKSDCVVVEGEFDALLLWQELGDLVDVVSLGSATGRLDDRWVAALLPIKHFWIATDSDDGGKKAARYWLELTGERGERILPPRGAKDVTEAWQSGADLRAWLQDHIDPGGRTAVVAREPVADLEARLSRPFERRDEMASAAWAPQHAMLVEEVQWPCFGTSWQEWAEAVASSCDQASVPDLGAEEAPDVSTRDRRLLPDDRQESPESPEQDDARPTEPCRSCGIGEHRRFWKGAGGWVCATCHPPPHSDVELWELPHTEP